MERVTDAAPRRARRWAVASLSLVLSLTSTATAQTKTARRTPTKTAQSTTTQTPDPTPPHDTKSGDPSKDPVELRWIRLEGAEQCPSKAVFEATLEKRLGRASFATRGSRILTVSLSNEKGPFRAVLSLTDRASDSVESKQELFSYSSQCDEVFAATVLSVALLLNPDEMEDSSPLLEPDDSDFFAPPSGDVGLGVPARPSGKSGDPDQTYAIPIAPRPWSRTRSALSGSFLVGLEQLPTTALGFSLRGEWPVARAWLLWLSGDWLESDHSRELGTDVTVVQTSGWVGGSWLPYKDDLLEVHVFGGAGFRQLTATLTAVDPQRQVALQLGAAMVVQLSETFALDGRAAAIVPLQSAYFGPAWTQPDVGGQLQIGITVGIPNPTAPD